MVGFGLKELEILDMKISVCLASYNGEKYIKQQIDSIINQLRLEDELIISDDGSIDSTCKIINSYNDSRIRLLHNTEKHGFVGNFENALKHATGNYIFLSDQDDLWKENKIKICIDELQRYKLLIHNAELIDANGKSMGKSYFSCTHKSKSFIMNCYKTRWLGCCMAFHRDVLDYCLPFPNGIVAHDYWIGMIGMLRFKYSFIDDELICYRRHGHNLSYSSEKSRNSIYYKLFTKRIRIFVMIIIRILHL